MPDNSDHKWYVVHTYSGYENKVMTDLEKMVENRGMQNLISEIRVPTETVTEIKDGKEKTFERKLFRGYVFVKMNVTDDSWYVVRNTRGVTGFVGAGNKPVPLSENEVAALGVEQRSVELAYKVGDEVRIINGPLEGFTGIVAAIDKPNNSARVNISAFGRETPVDLELGQISPAVE